MSTQFGNYLTKYGTDANDYGVYLQGELYLGLNGDDNINAIYGYEAIYDPAPLLALFPSIAIGGEGNDQYSTGAGGLIISDRSNSFSDSLHVLAQFRISKLFSIDSRHLFFQFDDEHMNYVLIIDALNTDGAIERISFNRGSFGTISFTANELLGNHKTSSDLSLDNFVSQDFIDLSWKGITKLGMKDAINTLSQFVDPVAGKTLRIDYLIVDKSGFYVVKIKSGLIESASMEIMVSGDSHNQKSFLTSTIDVDYSYVGTSGADTLTGSKGANGESWAHDLLDAGDGDDFLGGGGGRDVMKGGNGSDELRGGYGHDILDGGAGSDILYGGGGRNTFNNNNDGSIDQLFVLSDYHSHNQPTGRLHNGANADTISSLGVEDKITILGASTSELSIRQLTNGLGIFASGSLEAIVTETSWNATSLANNVFGDATRYS